MPHDVRSVANVVLNIAADQGQPVSNLSLNKILYFLHVAHLQQFGRPLVSAKIEAWNHGPVFREIYHQFKSFGKESISGPAKRLDPLTGAFVEVAITLSIDEQAFVHANVGELLRLSPGKLVDMSHVRDGPWYTARFGNGRINPGVEITNEMILACRYQQARH